MKKQQAALAAGFVLGVIAQGAIAQEASATSPARAASAADGAADPAATVQSVVVTANKREERLQDVPIAVSVVDSAQIARQHVSEVTDLVRSVPALNTAGPFGALNIRGIGSLSFSRSSEGSVGVVVDGVALAGGSTTPPGLFDVARVEVLEGPQGTLFGRNSSAGLINIVTNAPDPRRLDGAVHLDAGTRGENMASAMLNLPLAEHSALRFSGSFGHQPETLKNLDNDTWNRTKLENGRLRFLWEPTADLSANLIADRSETRENGGAPWAIYQSTPGSVLSTRLAQCGVTVSPDNQQGCVQGGNIANTETDGYSAQVDAKLRGYVLSSITALRRVHTDTPTDDVDNLPVDLLQQSQVTHARNLSQELKLVSPTSDLGDYVLGLYYFDGRTDAATTQFGPLLTYAGMPYPLGQTLATNTTSHSYAAYGQGNYYLSDDLRLNLGLRYGRESVSAHTRGTLAPGAVAPIAGIGPVDGAVGDNYLSYRVGAQYNLSPSQMSYVSYTRGFKGAAVNDQSGGSTSAPLLVKPEIPHAAELGLKSSYLNGRLAVDAALFYTKVDDFQAQFFDVVSAQYINGNAPSLTSRGVSLNLLGKPSSSLTINGGLTFTDARYGAGYTVSCYQQQTAAQGCQPLLGASGAVVGTGASADGHQLVGSPRWKSVLGGEYVAPLMARQAFLQGDIVYTSRVNDDATGDPAVRVAGATIVGGRAGLRSADGRWSLALFARNLFDTFRPTVRFAAPTALQELDPKAYAQMTGPESRRVVGLSLDARL